MASCIGWISHSMLQLICIALLVVTAISDIVTVFALFSTVNIDKNGFNLFIWLWLALSNGYGLLVNSCWRNKAFDSGTAGGTIEGRPSFLVASPPSYISVRLAVGLFRGVAVKCPRPQLIVVVNLIITLLVYVAAEALSAIGAFVLIGVVLIMSCHAEIAGSVYCVDTVVTVTRAGQQLINTATVVSTMLVITRGNMITLLVLAVGMSRCVDAALFLHFTEQHQQQQLYVVDPVSLLWPVVAHTMTRLVVCACLPLLIMDEWLTLNCLNIDGIVVTAVMLAVIVQLLTLLLFSTKDVFKKVAWKPLRSRLEGYWDACSTSLFSVTQRKQQQRRHLAAAYVMAISQDKLGMIASRCLTLVPLTFGACLHRANVSTVERSPSRHWLPSVTGSTVKWDLTRVKELTAHADFSTMNGISSNCCATAVFAESFAHASVGRFQAFTDVTTVNCIPSAHLSCSHECISWSVASHVRDVAACQPPSIVGPLFQDQLDSVNSACHVMTSSHVDIVSFCRDLESMDAISCSASFALETGVIYRTDMLAMADLTFGTLHFSRIIGIPRRISLMSLQTTLYGAMPVNVYRSGWMLRISRHWIVWRMALFHVLPAMVVVSLTAGLDMVGSPPLIFSYPCMDLHQGGVISISANAEMIHAEFAEKHRQMSICHKKHRKTAHHQIYLHLRRPISSHVHYNSYAGARKSCVAVATICEQINQDPTVLSSKCTNFHISGVLQHFGVVDEPVEAQLMTDTETERVLPWKRISHLPPVLSEISVSSIEDDQPLMSQFPPWANNSSYNHLTEAGSSYALPESTLKLSRSGNPYPSIVDIFPPAQEGAHLAYSDILPPPLTSHTNDEHPIVDIFPPAQEDTHLAYSDILPPPWTSHTNDEPPIASPEAHDPSSGEKVATYIQFSSHTLYPPSHHSCITSMVRVVDEDRTCSHHTHPANTSIKHSQLMQMEGVSSSQGIQADVIAEESDYREELVSRVRSWLEASESSNYDDVPFGDLDECEFGGDLEDVF